MVPMLQWLLSIKSNLGGIAQYVRLLSIKLKMIKSQYIYLSLLGHSCKHIITVQGIIHFWFGFSFSVNFKFNIVHLMQKFNMGFLNVLVFSLNYILSNHIYILSNHNYILSNCFYILSNRVNIELKFLSDVFNIEQYFFQNFVLSQKLPLCTILYVPHQAPPAAAPWTRRCRDLLLWPRLLLGLRLAFSANVDKWEIINL